MNSNNVEVRPRGIQAKVTRRTVRVREGSVASAIACALALCCAAAGARAATLSDELQIFSGSTQIFDGLAYDPVSGTEPVVAFAAVTSGSSDYSATMGTKFGSAGSVVTWLAGVAGSLHVAYLMEPSTSTTAVAKANVSDVLLSFQDVVGGAKVNIVALISDPTQVGWAFDAAQAASTGAVKLIPVPTATNETGTLQNVTALLYPSGIPPYVVNVLSAVPEPSTAAGLLAGLFGLGATLRRRRR